MHCAKIPRPRRDYECEGGLPLPKAGRLDYSVSIDSDIIGSRCENQLREDQMSRVWIEVALNGPWGRERQPGIPITIEEIVADGLSAADAGAAIIHVHAYDPATGRQHDQWETYARIIEGIRAKADVIVYPTIPLAGSDYASANAQRRFAHTAELAKRGMLEWTVCDPGSCNFTRFDEIDDLSAGFVYQNPIAERGFTVVP
jgi:3-keto-5-aminohexanoate cleavage enzyme